MSNGRVTDVTTIPSAATLRALWTEPFSRGDDAYDVREEIGEQLIGVSRDGHPALIVRLDRFEALPGRVVGRVKLRFLKNTRLEVGPEVRYADVAAFECLHSAVVDTFAAFVSDLLEDLGLSASRPAAILDAFARWHDLLAGRDRLSGEVEQGLWGELAVLEIAPDIDAAQAAWNGPGKGVIDFLRGKVGIEVKTSRRRRCHTIRFDQALFGETDYAAYLVSLWVQPNEAGTTLPEMIGRIANRLVDKTSFHKKILGLGYREELADHYALRLKLVEDPVAFPMRVVPRIDHVPDGASNVRWDVDLGSKTAADEVELGPILARISGVSE